MNKKTTIIMFYFLVFFISPLWAADKQKFAIIMIQRERAYQEEIKPISDLLVDKLNQTKKYIAIKFDSFRIGCDTDAIKAIGANDCIAEMGKKINADKLALCDIRRSKEEYIIDLKIFYSENGELEREVTGRSKFINGPRLAVKNVIKGIMSRKYLLMKEKKNPIMIGNFNFSGGWRSLVLPGTGQMYKGEKEKGLSILLRWGGTLGVGAVSYILGEASYGAYRNATNKNSVSEFWNATVFFDTVAIACGVTVLGTWVYSVIDAGWNKGGDMNRISVQLDKNKDIRVLYNVKIN